MQKLNWRLSASPSKTMVPLRNTLVEMRWPQSKSTIQTDKLTAAGFTNNTIINKAIKSLDMNIWWLRDRESQDKFHYYWAPGPDNEGDYSTKHHLTI